MSSHPLPTPSIDLPAGACAADLERRFSAVGRVWGPSAGARLARAHVAIAGIGGVGSWAVEALARSGVGHLTLIDLDHVAESNINRQVQALDTTLGQAKVLAMKDRIGQINPACQVQAVEAFVEPGAVALQIPAYADVVLDCTDAVPAKVAMVLCSRERGQSLLVCGAAGGKTDSLSLRVGDLRDATHDALLARLRNVLRKRHGYPPATGRRPGRLGVTVLWFSQPALAPGPGADGVQAGAPLACAGYGSLVTVTAAMGLAAAASAMDRIVRTSPV